jgi:uncharacterized cupredoxin-like copper-binding protein
MHRPASIIAVLAVATVALTGCGNNEPKPSGGGSNTPGGGTVAVTLQEWAVLPAQATIAAGKVTFNVKNNGPKHEHEFVVFKTDLDPGSLPKKADGSVDEEGAGVQALGEIEPFAVSKTQPKEFNLAAGKYVLFCNVVETEAMPDMGGIKSHYQLGMRTAFTVT